MSEYMPRTEVDPFPFGEHLDALSNLDKSAARFLEACDDYAGLPHVTVLDDIEAAQHQSGEDFLAVVNLLSADSPEDEYIQQVVGLMNGLTAARAERLNRHADTGAIPDRSVRDPEFLVAGGEETSQRSTIQDILTTYYVDMLERDVDCYVGAINESWEASRQAETEVREAVIKRNAIGLGALTLGAVSAAAILAARVLKRRS